MNMVNWFSLGPYHLNDGQVFPWLSFCLYPMLVILVTFRPTMKGVDSIQCNKT